MRPVRVVIYPGSFDPLTNGHLDVIGRAAKIFDRVVVAVANNIDKRPWFTVEERCELIRADVAAIPNAETDAFDGLLVDYAARRGAVAVVRGLRAVSDFEFEFQLALMNRRLDERVETIFMTPREAHSFISSRMVKEIAAMGGDAGQFVPPNVAKALRTRVMARGRRPPPP
jgi:pantetheine-phosphate adenylyltransferase